MTTGAREAGDVVVYVEIPAGSRNKYELDKATGACPALGRRGQSLHPGVSVTVPAMPPPREVDYGAAVYGSVLVAALVAAEFESTSTRAG